MIDWEQELASASKLADSKEERQVVQLQEGSSLSVFTYENADGTTESIPLGETFQREGSIRINAGGYPVEITKLPGSRIEVFFPVGYHEYAKDNAD